MTRTLAYPNLWDGLYLNLPGQIVSGAAYCNDGIWKWIFLRMAAKGTKFILTVFELKFWAFAYPIELLVDYETCDYCMPYGTCRKF